MRAEIEMMKKETPEYADCWEWGICEINDICKADGLVFQYGENIDKPSDFPDSDVWVKYD